MLFIGGGWFIGILSPLRFLWVGYAEKQTWDRLTDFCDKQQFVYKNIGYGFEIVGKFS